MVASPTIVGYIHTTVTTYGTTKSLLCTYITCVLRKLCFLPIGHNFFAYYASAELSMLRSWEMLQDMYNGLNKVFLSSTAPGLRCQQGWKVAAFGNGQVSTFSRRCTQTQALLRMHRNTGRNHTYICRKVYLEYNTGAHSISDYVDNAYKFVKF
jgi:hypothetical protein